MKNGRLQAKDLPEDELLRLLGQKDYSFLWEIAGEFSAFPVKVVLAKMRALVRRNLVEGCACGCSGNFRLVRHWCGVCGMPIFRVVSSDHSWWLHFAYPSDGHTAVEKEIIVNV